jgi:aryl-alcohol dehydrogenase-like predicted oxidoreductase
LKSTYETIVNCGINLIDTAEIYSSGNSEKAIGALIPHAKQKMVIETKIFPSPIRLTEASFFQGLRQSLKRLDLPQVDIYMLHFPFPPISIENWMNWMANAVGEGLIRAVGICNCDNDQMKRAAETLAKRNLSLVCNQVEFSLLKRDPLRSGLLKLCKEMKISLIAYRPLTAGLLSGKFTPENMPGLIRGQVYTKNTLKKWTPLLEKTQSIADRYGKSLAQVALNWLICKDVIPIPGVTKPEHVKENVGALGWRLEERDELELDLIGEGIDS